MYKLHNCCSISVLLFFSVQFSERLWLDSKIMMTTTIDYIHFCKNEQFPCSSWSKLIGWTQSHTHTTIRKAIAVKQSNTHRTSCTQKELKSHTNCFGMIVIRQKKSNNLLRACNFSTLTCWTKKIASKQLRKIKWEKKKIQKKKTTNREREYFKQEASE